MDDAHKKAGQLATLAGVNLGTPVATPEIPIDNSLTKIGRRWRVPGPTRGGRSVRRQVMGAWY
jgi:hypothetical protein